MNSREQLILDHMPQVRLLATRQHRLCPPSVELDDLMSVGTVGLLQAVEKFRPERGFKLKTLAEHRIRGAMLDYLRQIDPLPREIRTFARRRDVIVLNLESRLGRSATDEELATELGVPIAKYRRWILAIRASNTISLDSTAKWDDELPQVAVQAVNMEAVESLHRLETAIGNLPDREAQVAAALTDGKSAREIASELGLSEASVSRIKTRAIRHLRLSLRAA